MSRSDLVLRAAAANPAMGRAAVRLWARSYLRRPRSPHWVFSALRSALGVRIGTRVRLLNAHDIIVDPFDYVGRRIAAHGCYEPETVALVQRIAAPGMVVIDAGAHIGQYTLVMSAGVGAGGSVHAFEPDPVTCEALRTNVQLNRIRNARCNQMALSSAPGRCSLYLADVANIGGNSLRQTGHYGGRNITVAVSTLDDYVKASGLSRLDLVKADVEGAELHLLRGGAAAIARFKPMLVLEVSINERLFDYDSAALLSQLHAWDYDVFRVGPLPLRPHVPSHEDPADFNILAVHRDTVAALIRRGVVARPASPKLRTSEGGP